MEELSDQQKKIFEEALKLAKEAGQKDRENQAALRLFSEALAKTAARLDTFMTGERKSLRGGSGETQLANAEKLAANITGTKAALSDVDEKLTNVAAGSPEEAALIQQKEDLTKLIEQFTNGIDAFLDSDGPFGLVQTRKLEQIRSDLRGRP